MEKQLNLTILRMANNGKGVAAAPDGKAVFVTDAVPGDRIRAEITAKHSRFYEARITEILDPSPNRIPSDCPVLNRCGGCCFRQMTYEQELAAKTSFVQDAFRRIGGFELTCEPILASSQTSSYRNKAEFAIGYAPDGNLFAGFFSEKTHRVVPVPNCRLIPKVFLQVIDCFLQIANRDRRLFHNRKTGAPFLHHLVLRKSGLNDEIMLIIAAAKAEKGLAEAAEQIRTEIPKVTSVILNISDGSSGPILGIENRILSGQGFIKDQILGVPVEIGPLSFFQVNTPAAELLYQAAAMFANIRPEDTVLDLYCGMGTIGLSIGAEARQLIGGEIISEAVESAKRSAAAMTLSNTRFLCGDAAKIAKTLIQENLHPNIIILDPPRRGCSQGTLQAVQTLNPERIIMISCDPATAARDCRILCENGYALHHLRPVDLFPRTKHVETCVLLTHPFMSKS